MAHQAAIHEVQVIILKQLLFQPKANFAALMKQAELSSDHFNFHLKELINLGYITKLPAGGYTLTPSGKEHANKLDTDSNTIERQPKVAVLLNIRRNTARGPELLVQQRLKQPFYGFWGIPTGKIRWGETIIETAQRELFEETGLTCENPMLYGIYHKLDYDKETKKLLEDKIFFKVACINPQGELIEEFEGGKNKFVTLDEIPSLGKQFEGITTHFADNPEAVENLVENKHFYSQEEY